MVPIAGNEMGRDLLKELKDQTLVAVAGQSTDWPSALLSKTLIPDKWMGLVETRDGRRRFAPAGDDPRPEKGDRLLLVRDRPITIPIEVNACKGAQGNLINGRCEVWLRWASDVNDLAALSRAHMDSNQLSLDTLAHRFCNRGGRDALENFIRRHTAEQLVHDRASGALLDALREGTKKFCFESGATIDQVANIDFTSDTLAEQEAAKREAHRRVERIKSREMVEAAALKATNRRLNDLSGLLDKLKQASSGDDSQRWHDLLPALSPTERGRLLENLWRLTPNRTTADAIVAVAGQVCVWHHPVDPERELRRVTIGDELGGLRSIFYAPDQRLLLIGAATGVWTLDRDGSGEPLAYAVADAGSQRTGFNAAVVSDQHLFATHSKLGCWRWLLQAGTAAQPVLRPENDLPTTVRAVTVSRDGRVFFAAGSKIMFYDSATDELVEFTSVSGTVHAIAILDDELYVGTGDGKLLCTKLDSPRSWRTVHRARDAIESISVRRWNDLVELVIPAGDDGVQGVYGDENLAVRLMESAAPIRRAWACDDVVVGLADRRDKLLVMNANLPERTAREIPVGRTLGHSIQDACLVTVQRPMTDSELSVT
jgi:hypothetical protein